MAPSDSGSFSDGTSVCSNYALTLGKLEPFPNSFSLKILLSFM